MRKPIGLAVLCASFAVPLAGCMSLNDMVPFAIEDMTPFNQPAQAVGAISVATIIVTDKTMVDHFVSFLREEDCSTVRASIGEKYCRPIRVAYTPPPEPFCYRSLAKVSCFATPNPYGSDHRMGSYLPGITRVE